MSDKRRVFAIPSEAEHVETRPALDGIDEGQRVLALCHWYLFRVVTEQPETLEYCWPASVTPSVLLRQMEGSMNAETRRRLAMARGRYHAGRSGKIVDTTRSL